MEKPTTGVQGKLLLIRDYIREKYLLWKENYPLGIKQWFDIKILRKEAKLNEENAPEKYTHIFRRKTRQELVRISAAVMGIEFSYAAETAFVSPTLLQIGVEHQHMTLVWALSPLVGLFLTPLLGSLSDRCYLNFGRRRPFIIAMSLGVLIGLILVPNGELLGYLFGDPRPDLFNTTGIPQKSTIIGPRLWGRVQQNQSNIFPTEDFTSTIITLPSNKATLNLTGIAMKNLTEPLYLENNTQNKNFHPWGVFFTILGTVLLDFDADGCQSPARAYLLDVTTSDDHARGLSTFSIMAGLGGFMGYALGGINWDVTFLGELLGGHVRAVFTLITIIFIICVSYTVTSFREMPLHVLTERENIENFSSMELGLHNKSFEMNEENSLEARTDKKYGSVESVQSTSMEEPKNVVEENKRKSSTLSDSEASLKTYLQSIIYMPNSIRILCLTNLFCWMAHVCYSLYFTDFVGEAVFGGNPTAPVGSKSKEQYETGVRFGCWGMSLYSLCCAFYSTFIEKLILKFGSKKVYLGGLLTYSTGMLLMALTKNKLGVILFSGTAGVMYSTLFTMPYLIIAHYHAKGVFEVNQEGQGQISKQIRGLGTDIAIISSMVFLAQFILSICMGTIISLSGTTTAVVSVACCLAFFGAISATQIMYLDL